MIEENWLDAVSYDISFENVSGTIFHRTVIVPFDFLEEDVKTFFCNHFKKERFKVISIIQLNCVWLSKKITKST